MKLISVAFLPLLVCLLLSCGSKPDSNAEPTQEIQKSRLAGRVERVNLASEFVRIRRYGPWRVSEHEVVVSRGGGRNANLLPTGEKLGEYIAADIRSGVVEVGDAVYIRQVSEKLTSKDTQSSGKPENTSTPEN